MDLKALQQAKEIETKINELSELLNDINKQMKSEINNAYFMINGFLRLPISNEYAIQIAEEYYDEKEKELKKLQRDLSEL